MAFLLQESADTESDKERGPPPVPSIASKDGFFHSGDSFYVELDQHRYEREECGSLYGLLTYTAPAPLRTKAGKIAKRQPPPHQDPPGPFYCAQLLHYGLEPSKTKEAAKKRLLAAFSADGTLAVPKDILQLEKTLKQEYARASEIANEAYRKRLEMEEIEEEERRKNGKRSYDAVLQAFLGGGDYSVVSDAGSDEGSDSVVEPAAKRRKFHNEVVVGSSRSGGPTSGKKLTGKKPTLERGVRTSESARSLGTAIGKGSKTDSKVEKAKEAKTKQKSQALDGIELMGQFEIVAPYLSSEWPDQTESMTLKMSLSSTSSHLWASFDFGIVSGIIRSSSLPSKLTAGTAYAFLWRGRESEESVMTFGPENTGSITFLGGGKIKGRMEWMEGFEFGGKKEVQRGKVVPWSKRVSGWKSEWRGINERSYGRANVSRWGAWGGDEDEDEPQSSNSDTS